MNPESRNISLLSIAALLAALLIPEIASAQTTVNLTAQRTSATLPDGKTVAMWGYCGGLDSATSNSGNATSVACGTGWTPGPTITVAQGDTLTINLSNSLGTPTSVWINGQLGGGLGHPVYGPAISHAAQTTVTFPGVADGTFTPPVQGPRVRSFVPEADIGSGQTYTWTNLKAGTYLYETATYPSLQVPMGLYGVLIVTEPANYPGVAYDAEAMMMFSEIDPAQNAAVDAAANEFEYPPAVNYSPRYFLINGAAFDRNAPENSVFPITSAYSSGNVLLRMLNAGIRSHTPSLVGLPVTLLAEDSHILPGTPVTQNEVMLEAAKTRDVIVKPAHDATTFLPATHALFDRQLSLTNDNQANGGMQGFLQVAGGGGPITTAATVAVPFVVNDIYTNPADTTFNGNVTSNDVLITSVAVVTAPAHGTLSLDAGSGNFVYTPDAGFAGVDTFTYNGNGGTTNIANVTLNVTADPVAAADSYTSKVATMLKVAMPGVLQNDSDPVGYSLTAQPDPAHPLPAWVTLNADGSFVAQPPAPNPSGSPYSFYYVARNSAGMVSAPAVVTLDFPAGSGLSLTVKDTQDPSILIADYRWVIEEDITYKNDPLNPTQANTCTPAQAQAGTCTPPQSLATNFHKSHMPLVAAGCTGPLSCGDAQPETKQNPTSVADVVLDPNKHYYISILPGDAGVFDEFGHSMAGVAVAPGQSSAVALAPRTPLPPAQMSIFVFEDNSPTNGDLDQDEVGLGGFRIEFSDTRGSSGDVAGTITYDALAMPLTNSLMDGSNPDCPKTLSGSSEVGVVITCPNFRADGTPSPLAGMAVVKNMIPGRIDVFAMPGADREAAGETWIQISTLEGTTANDTFTKPGEPPYWQEFGSPGFHSVIGFVNPAHVKAVNDANIAAHATGTVSGRITSLHMDRPPAAKLNNSCQPGSDEPACARAALSFTDCYVALNSLAGEGPDVAMAECDADGNFQLSGVPDGDYSLFIWDTWLDQIKAMKNVTVPDPVSHSKNVAMGDIPVFSWFTRLTQTVYTDVNENGVRDPGEPGVPNLLVNIRFRDGSIANQAVTDSNGVADFSEVFPLFNWYVAEANWTRFKGTGVNITYDAGGLTDKTGRWAGVLNSTETFPVPEALRVPGAKYTDGTTSRIDPGGIIFEGFQGFINQTQVIDWGTANYRTGENGGIGGMVFYANTRGVDDPRLGGQLPWSPGIPRIPVNLYLKKADGNLQLVDTTTSNSWDDSVASGSPNEPHCPGNAANDPFITYTLGAANQFKCYDGQHNFNQVQPVPYDGFYSFPSDHCKICKTVTVTNPDGSTSEALQLPAGVYVVEVSPPPGYETVKEEDKNIYGGDVWIGPAVQQFAGLGNVFILPDQATLNSNYNPVYGPASPPCVGHVRQVPQYLSLVPDAQQYTPYAGQMRPLCDRKEVRLNDMTAGVADFQLFTPTPIAAHFSGMMLNDAAAEFDPFSPSFGEKAALPNAPVSIRDYNGVEILRTYNDKWGTFNGLVPSTWNANAPNPSGFESNMLTNCMNDPGPIPDPSGAIDPVTDKVRMIIDPAYNPMFSNFCYTWPFMPGITTYLDTPVLPVAAFATGSGYNPVDCQYPDATPAIRRVDGNGLFGPYMDMTSSNKTLSIVALGDVEVLNPAYTGPTAMTAETNRPKITRHYGFGASQGSHGKVTLGGKSLQIDSWNDEQIVVTIPDDAVTGQLEITADNGKTSEDAITVTIGGRAPTYVVPSTNSVPDPQSNLGLAHPIQDAIDAAHPGDLIMLQSGHYPELVIIWKPVRLQGVGAASVIINAAKYPTTKIANWRTRIDPLFGLDAAGNALPGLSQVDPLPGQPVGGFTLLEPTSLASEEGPGILVLAKNPAAIGCADPTIAAGLTSMVSESNFNCAASRIDGVTVTGGDSGGGVYVNGWANNLEISNNRIYGNAGTINGGLRVGQEGLEGQTPGSDGQLGYNVNVNIHNNAVTTNGTVDSNAAVLTPGGAAPGGIAIYAGSDNYKVTHNWVCGNFSSGDGGGIGHIGLSNNGTISHNKILFNQSYNQGSTVNGGGLAIEGEMPTGTTLSLGSGNVTVDSNQIVGNFAQGGHGGGVMLFAVNGDDVAQSRNSGNWWRVTLTNNIITNNVAGWSGGGISLADTINSVLANNTIASNDSAGIAGTLFSTQVGGSNTGPSTTVPSAAGISSDLTSAGLIAALNGNNTRRANRISNPRMTNNIIWHNRSFFFDMSTGVTRLLPSNQWSDAVATDLASHAVLGPQTTTGECVSGAAYWDLGVIGDTSPNPSQPGGNPGTYKLSPTYSYLSSTVGYTGNNNRSSDPGMVRLYCNGSRVQPGAQFEPATPFLPDFQLNPAATLDEAGNFVDLHYGPLSLTDPAQPASTEPVGDYHLASVASDAYNRGASPNSSNGVPHTDFDEDIRPQFSGTTRLSTPYDIGADEIAFVKVSPAALGFGSVQANSSQVPSSKLLTVTVTNVSNATMNFGGGNGNLANGSSNNFSRVNYCGTSLAAGDSCTVDVTFTPTGSGNRTATLNVVVGGMTLAVQVSGTAVAPSASAVPSPLAFGNQLVNTTSAARQVTLVNTGIGPLFYSSVALCSSATGSCSTSGNSTGQFALQSSNCPAILAVGDSCAISLTFGPTSTGNKTAYLRITDGAGTQSVQVTGTGVAPSASRTPSSLNFGNQRVGTTSTARTVTLRNSGVVPLTFAGATITGSGASQFDQTNNCPAVLDPASVAGGTSSCTFSVTFSPTWRGNKSATLRMTDGAGTQTVSLSGRGN